MAEWQALLACPVCGATLEDEGEALACESGHSYDIARQGYVNLLPGDARPGTADTAEMVAARSAFLARGYFAPLTAALADAVRAAAAGVDGCVVDVGAGTGEYLAIVLECLPGRTGLALDISKHAARRAARAHPRIGAVVCDAWSELPVRSGVAAVVMSVFAPRNAAEFSRILGASGSLVVVTPTSRHLAELVGTLGMLTVDSRKRERLEEALGEHFACTHRRVVERELQLTREDALAAALMGPSAHHLATGEAEARVAELGEPITATLSVEVSIWRRVS